MSKKNDYQLGINYAQDVINGDVLAGKYVILACQRFVDDVEKCKRVEIDYHFDIDRIQRVCSFFDIFIKHIQGDLAGERYVMAPFEMFLIINVFGFINRDGSRRFNNAILFVARKNSKSTLAAGIALFELVCGETGGQIMSIATTREQAKVCWGIAKLMIGKFPAQAKEVVKTTVAELRNEKTGSYYRPLSKEAKSLDGYNVSMAIFDEASIITDRAVTEVILSSQGARKGRHINLYITTAQSIKNTVFFENYTYMKSILEGKVINEKWFGLLYELDADDDWRDDKLWIKSNPNIGVSFYKDFLINGRDEAIDKPSERNNFKIKHLNMWQNSSRSWISRESWALGEVDKISTKGRLFVGMDLSEIKDLTALVFLFEYKDDGGNVYYHLDYRCFSPENTIKNVPRFLKDVYQNAIDSGKLIIIKGSVIDIRIIKDFLIAYTKDKDLIEVSYDRWGAMQLVSELIEEGLPMVETSQTMVALAAPVKEVEKNMITGGIKHLKDNFFEWQLDNSEVYVDTKGNCAIRKGDDPTKKIDGVVALIFAMARAMNPDERQGKIFFLPPD